MLADLSAVTLESFLRLRVCVYRAAAPVVKREWHIGREYAAVFISAISDKNERGGYVYLLHSVTSTHRSSELCIDEQPPPPVGRQSFTFGTQSAREQSGLIKKSLSLQDRNVRASCFSGVRFRTKRWEDKPEVCAVVSRWTASDNQIDALGLRLLSSMTNKPLQRRHQAIGGVTVTGKSKPDYPDAQEPTLGPVLSWNPPAANPNRCFSSAFGL